MLRTRIHKLSNIAAIYSKASGGGGLDPATSAWISAVTTAGGSVSGTQQTRVDTLIKGLKTDGLFTIGDRLWIYAGESDVHQAAIDLIANSAHTLVGSPTMSATGYTGDGTAAAINTNYNPSTGTHWALNSASMLAYTMNARTTNNWAFMGVGDGTNFAEFYPDTSGNGIANLNSTNFPSFANVNTQGSWLASRTVSSSTAIYLNGSAIVLSPLTSTSTGVPNSTFYTLADNQTGTPINFGIDTLGAVWMGGGLNSTQASNLQSRINTYMTAWGINVY